MKKVLSFIGAAIYGYVAAKLLYYLFYFATPWLMSFGWIGVICYIIFLGGLMPAIFGSLGSIIFMPIIPLVSNCPASRYLPIFFLISSGVSSAIFPWFLDMEYTFIKYVIATSITIIVIQIFVSLIWSIYSASKKNE